MFFIVKLLCTKETMDFIRNCGVRVISMYLQKTGECRTPPMFDGVRFSKQSSITHPRSGPTSLFAVVSKLLAAHPETYTTSSHRAICVICTGSTAPSVCTGWPSLAALSKMAYSLSASSVEGRGKGGSDPCFEATATAEYGRDNPENRGWEKK